MSETCATCRFFHVKRIKDNVFTKCRRFPTEIPVKGDHWCGEWAQWATNDFVRTTPAATNVRTGEIVSTIPPATADGPGVGKVIETKRRGKHKK